MKVDEGRISFNSVDSHWESVLINAVDLPLYTGLLEKYLAAFKHTHTHTHRQESRTDKLLSQCFTHTR